MIRLISHQDAQELFDLVDSNRAYLREWMPWLDANQRLSDTRSFIERSLHEYADSKSVAQVIIHEGRIAGVCDLHSIDWSISGARIGYWIARRHQGLGLVTGACRELESIAFEQLALNKVEIFVAPANTRSRAVAERLGYEMTGRIYDAEWLYDHYVDHVVYCRRRTDRHAMPAAPASCKDLGG